MDNDYGHNAARSLQSELYQSGLACLAYMEVVPLNSDPNELERIAAVMKKSTARVVISFVFESRMAKLLEEVWFVNHDAFTIIRNLKYSYMVYTCFQNKIK